MPPVFGPGVAVADALVVLRGRQRPRRVAVAEREQRDLRADEQLLDDERRGPHRRARRRPASRPRAASASAASSQTTTPLPAARPSALTTQAPPSASRARAPRSSSWRVNDVRRSARRPPASRPSRTPSSPPAGRPPRRARTRERRRGAARRRARPRAAPRARPRRGRQRARRASWTRPSMSARGPDGTSRARAMPGLPGAACSSVDTRGCGRAQQRARARVRRSRRAGPSRASIAACGRTSDLVARAGRRRRSARRGSADRAARPSAT